MGTSGKGSTVPSCILPLVIFKDASQNALSIICDYWLEVIAHGYFWSGLDITELFIIFGHFQGC